MFLIPENEQGTIVTFVQMEKLHGFKIVSIGIKYPDAIVERDGVEYRAEFEFMASNFIAHQHDIRKCDIVICWESDINKSEFPLPILELSDQSSISNALFVPNETKVELFYWKNKAKSSDRVIKQLNERLNAIDPQKQDCIPKVDKAAERRKYLLVAYKDNPRLSMGEASAMFGASKGTISGDLKWFEDRQIISINRFGMGKGQTVVLNDGSEEFLKGL